MNSLFPIANEGKHSFVFDCYGWTLPTKVNTLKPVEDVDTVLQVQHPNEAGEDTEDGGLRGPEAVNEHDGFVLLGEPGDTVHEVDTVRHGHTEVRPVGTEDHLDSLLHLLQLEVEADTLVA